MAQPLPVKLRKKLLNQVLLHRVPVSRACKELGVSRFTFYKWLKRYQADGSLKNKPRRVKHFWRQAEGEIVEQVRRLALEHPQWSKYQIQKNLSLVDSTERPQIGVHGVYNILKRLSLTTAEKRQLQSQAGVFQEPRILTPEERVAMIERVLKGGATVAKTCRELGVSRFTFYKWLKRYQLASQQGAVIQLADKVRQIPRWARQATSQQEEIVLKLVIEYPDLSKYKLAEKMRRMNLNLSLGPHGVYNILRRHNLTLPELRLSYAQAAAPAKPTFGLNHIKLVWQEFISGLAPAPPPFRFAFPIYAKWKHLLPSFFIAFVFTFIVTNLFIFWIQLLVQAPSFADRIGLVFATISLLIGGLFFVYSMKYYFSLALVLSFSRNPKEEGGGYSLSINGKVKANNNSYGGFIGWIAKILGVKSSFDSGSKETPDPGSIIGKGSGLQPSLDYIHPKRYPFFSIHLPFYNEKKVAERIIRACMGMQYSGNYEVIVCDDSNDETVEIIRNLMKKLGQIKEYQGDGGDIIWQVDPPGKPTLKVLHRATRSGFKGGALSHALKALDPRTEFICVFDADFVPYPDTLEQFLKYFKASGGWDEEKNFRQDKIVTIPYDTLNPAVSRNISFSDQSIINQQLVAINQQSMIAVVTGYQWHVLNKSENWITRGVRTEYAGSYVVERPGQEILGAMKIIHGSVYCIRADVLKHFGWGTSITEDYELTLRIYEQGFKVVFTPYIQAPSECVSTLKRLIRQRMRWAEGHSFNTRKMAANLLFGKFVEGKGVGPKTWQASSLTLPEKLEFLYLAPYYLQAAFFIVGTLSWLLSEMIFKVKLPFWTALWGWSLVLTNFFSLPLVNAVGLFLEESEEKDYIGLFSFILLCYILTPFQAYAAVKGFIRKTEGPWFRTPKTGRVTDIFTRGSFYRWITGLIPGKARKLATAPISANQQRISDYQRIFPNQRESAYLALATANSHFNSFNLKRRRISWVGKATIALLLAVCLTLYSFCRGVPEVMATSVEVYYLRNATTDEDSVDLSTLYAYSSADTQESMQSGTGAANATKTQNNNADFLWFSRQLPTGTVGTGSVAAGVYTFNIYVVTTPTGSKTVTWYAQVGYCDGGCNEAADFHTLADGACQSANITYTSSSGTGLHQEAVCTTTNPTQIGTVANKGRLYFLVHTVSVVSGGSFTWGYNNSSGNYQSNLDTPTVTVPENLWLLAPLGVAALFWLKKKKRETRSR